MSSSTYLSTILGARDIDVCGISEHWLRDRDQHFMNSIHPNYDTFCMSDKALCFGGRNYGKGGVALMWKKQYTNNVVCLPLEDDRLIGIQIHLQDHSFIFFIQVYLPSRNNGIERYNEYIDILCDVIYRYSNKGKVIIMGDFNAHLQGYSFLKDNDSRSNKLYDFLTCNNYVAVNSLPLCQGAKSTFVSYDGLCESLIDHILSPVEMLDLVDCCEILDDCSLNVSSHRPVVCTFTLPPCYDLHNANSHRYVKWSRVSENEYEKYRSALNDQLAAFNCGHTQSTNCNNCSVIDDFYENICSAITQASDCSFRKKSFKPYLKPYWDDHIKQLHYQMRMARYKWLNNGRPRDHLNQSYIHYKNCKRNFRRYHRKCSENYLKHLNEELDNAAEVDSGFFWKAVNRRKNKFIENKCLEMRFNGVTYRDPKDIAFKWGEYFCDLYSDIDRPCYDSNFRIEIDDQVNLLKRRQFDDSVYTQIVYTDVLSELMSLKKGTACGPDNIYNEHLLFGGDLLIKKITSLFNLMLRYSHIPKKLKCGNIITLYKGGRKRKDDPGSYRAISLTSSILKLYERVLISRINAETNISFCPLQGGFQKGFSCTMSSFLLRECAYYAKQSKSKLYLCFLDVKTAFDKVWHNGLFFKLHCMGIGIVLWKAIVSLYENVQSCLIYNGFKSSLFNIDVGTRQGGVSSPYLYLCFIDKLLCDLENSGNVFSMGGLTIPAIASADDIVLLSLTKLGLQRMMDCCYDYACTWRYEFNTLKSAVIVCNESKAEYARSRRIWSLGENEVGETDNYTHLGINFNKFLDLSTNINEAISKIKGSFLSLESIGLGHMDGLHPFTSRKIYKAIILPRGLYGCEMWFDINQSSMLYLERSHRFCIKFMQNIGKRTRTDIALGLLCFLPISAEIDKKKLILFGQFCRLAVHSRAKDIFIFRMVQSCSPNHSTLGYFNDLVSVLKKYHLVQYLHEYVNSGMFPSNIVWKNIVRDCINKHEEAAWYARMETIEFAPFYFIHPCFADSYIWRLCRQEPSMASFCRGVISMLSRLCGYKIDTLCSKCGCIFNDDVYHCMFECSYFEEERLNHMTDIGLKFGQYVLDVLQDMDNYERLGIMLGSPFIELYPVLSDIVDSFTKCNIVFVNSVWSRFKDQ
jgi:hypothetical protein